jgi:hypothetical protein
MPRSFATPRHLLYWEYSKLVAGSAIGNRKAFAFVNASYSNLVAANSPLPDILKENKIMLEQGNICAYCGAGTKLHWEHLIPISAGGPNHIDNLVRACEQCNLKKGSRDPYQWYSPDRLDNIPRLVLGKMLKTLFDAYASRNLLDSKEYMLNAKVQRTTLCQIFRQPNIGVHP